MISKLLKSNQPVVVILIIVLGIASWILSILHPIPMSIPSDYIKMPFYNFVESYIHTNSTVAVIITFLLVLVQSLLLVEFNKKYILINYRTYLPSFFYVLIASSFVQVQRLNPVIFGSVFMFIAIDFIYSTYRSEYALNKLYLAGFFISIASLFWAPFAIMFLLIWISLKILRPFIGREWIVSVLGFATPYLFVFTYYFVFKDEITYTAVVVNFIKNFQFFKPFYHLHYSYYIFYGFFLILIALASYSIVVNFQNKKIKTRKFFEMNWWLFILTSLIFIFFRNVKYEIVYLLAIPISFLITDYFYTVKRNWFLNSVVVILLGSLVYIQIIAHFG